jgi:thioredoxin 1
MYFSSILRPTWRPLKTVAMFFMVLCMRHAFAQDAVAPVFPPLEQWKQAIIAGDTEGLKQLFGTNPAAQITTVKGPTSDVAGEANFWTGLSAQQITLDVKQNSAPRPGIRIIVFQAEVQSAKNQTFYINEAQVWQQQSDQWRLFIVKRSEIAYLKQPLDQNKNIYPDGVDARAEIKEAQERAAKAHKRVLLVFGANWCFDCHVLDLAFQRPDFTPVVSRYEVVHIDIGPDGKKNGDIAKQFDVPLEKGVPALAVLDSQGKLLVSQKHGEFENARAMTPEAILEFLNKWKAE